jgi:hypothetical protein
MNLCGTSPGVTNTTPPKDHWLLLKAPYQTGLVWPVE